MLKAEATILIPTHRGGRGLEISIESALRQTTPVEIFVIGDGVDEETRRVALRMAEVHANVRFFDHPKGPRHGEVYRHDALGHATGRIVCYLSDDDLYLPHHVAEMSRLLDKADFAHALAVRAEPDGGVSTWTVDLNLEAHRRELLRGGNRIPLSAGAHTIEAYRGLEEGWSSAPEGTPTDLFMWRKFLRRPDCRLLAGTRPTVLVLPSSRRRLMNTEERYQELLNWADRLGTTEGAAELEGQILRQKVLEAARLDSVMMGVLHRETLPQCDTFQIFFPDKDGHNERRSVTFLMEVSSWRTIEFETPCDTPGIQIRLDPGTQPCLIELAQLEVVDSGGTTIWQLTESNRNDLELAGTAVWLGGGNLARVLSDGKDPQILLPSFPERVGPEKLTVKVTVRVDLEIGPLARIIGEQLRMRNALG